MADQIDRLILKTEGEVEVERLKTALEAEEKALRASIAAHGAHAAASRNAAQGVLSYQSQLKAAEAGVRQAGAATGSLTSSFTTLGYVINDADQINVSWQAGIRSLANNIPAATMALQNMAQVGVAGVTAALLSPAGLIIGLTALASLAPVIVAHWGDIEDAFGMGAVETEAEEFERLGKAIAKTADEQERFNTLKREEQTGKALQESEPAVTAAARQAALRATADLPAAALAQALADARNPQGYGPASIPLDTQKEITRQREFVEGQRNSALRGVVHGGDVSGPERVLKELEARGLEEGRTAEFLKAQADIAEAVADPEKFQKLIADLRSKGDETLTKLANQLEAAVAIESPEFKYQEEETAADQKESDRRLAARKQAAEQAVKDAEALTDADQAESDRRLAERKKEREARVKALAGGAFGTSLLRGDPANAEGAQSFLTDLGVGNVTEEVAQKYIDGVRRSIDEEVAARAIKDSTSEAEARARLLEEREERALKPSLDAAKEQGADLVAGAAAKGGADAARISRYLQSQGLDKDTADALAGEADTGARRDRLGQLLEGEKPRSSEVLEGASLADAIQKGIGGADDSGKLTVNELRAMNQKFERLLQQPPGSASVRLRRA
jgi:hypothetical protein